jgi:hypothetical protein
MSRDATYRWREDDRDFAAAWDHALERGLDALEDEFMRRAKDGFERPIMYGDTPTAMMLTDRAVAAYQDFIRVSGWIGNLAILIEAEFFGVQGPSAHFRDRYGREGRTIRGLTLEEHLARLRAELLPLAERCGRVMREALAALEEISAAPNRAVERSRPVRISMLFEPRSLSSSGARP